jgi:hypothetical protein
MNLSLQFIGECQPRLSNVESIQTSAKYWTALILQKYQDAAVCAPPIKIIVKVFGLAPDLKRAGLTRVP